LLTGPTVGPEAAAADFEPAVTPEGQRLATFAPAVIGQDMLAASTTNPASVARLASAL